MPQIAKGKEEFLEDGTARITRTSVVSGLERTIVMPIERKQYMAWKNGEMIQDAMPHLTNDQREFLMTGISQQEWDATFKEEE